MRKLSGPAINDDGLIDLKVYTEKDKLYQKFLIFKNGGFDYLDFNFGNLIYDYSKEWADNLKQASLEAGIKGAQTHGPILGKVYLENGKLYHKMTEREKKAAYNTFMLMNEFEIPIVVFHPLTLCPEKFGDELLEEHKRINIEFFNMLGEYANKFNVRIAVETAASLGGCRHYGAKVNELEELISDLDKETFGICVDIGHVFFEGYKPEEVIRRLGEKVIAFHIQDTNGFTDQHNIPPFGNVNWKNVCQAISDIGFNGTFSFETLGYKLSGIPEYLQLSMCRYISDYGKYLIDEIYNAGNRTEDIKREALN